MQPGISADTVRINRLFAAILAGDSGSVRALLEGPNAANLAQASKNGIPAVVLAAKNNSADILQLLLTHGALLNIQDQPEKNTPLITAVRFRAIACIEYLITIPGLNINLQDANGATALIHAVQLAYPTIAAMLITQANADVEITDKYGHTALYYTQDITLQRLLKNGCTRAFFEAIQRGEQEAVLAYLQTPDASADRCNAEGIPPLVYAVIHKKPIIVQALLENGANPAQLDLLGNSAIFYAIRDNSPDIRTLLIHHINTHPPLESDSESADETALVNNEDLSSLETENPIDQILDTNVARLALDQENLLGETPLCWAARHGDLPAFRDLISMGQLSIASTERTQTPLLSAAVQGGNLDIIRTIGDFAEIAINEPSKPDGQRALSFAATLDQAETIDYLFQKGADLNAGDKNGLTALMHAAKLGKNRAIAALLQHGADPALKDHDGHTALMYAASGSDIEAVNLLIARGPTARTDTNNLGKTAFQHALMTTKNPEILGVFLSAGESIERPDANGQTPLILAVMHSNSHIVKFLTQRHASLESTDREGNTAYLRAAASHTNTTLLRILQEAGANTGAINRQGMNALMMAARDNTTLEVTTSILSTSPCSVYARDYTGRTALSYAAQHNPNPAIIKALRDAGAVTDLSDNEGNTPLMFAAASNNPVIETLLDYCKATTNLINNKKCNALMIAASKNNAVATIKLLLAYGESPLVLSNETRNAIMDAALSNRKNVFKTLRNAASNLSIAELFKLHDSENNSILHLAVQNPEPAMLPHLLALKPTPEAFNATNNGRQGFKTPLMAAVTLGDTAKTTALLQYARLYVPNALHVHDINGRTAPLLAAISGQAAMLRAFYAADSRTITSCDSMKNNALHLGHLSVIDTILEAAPIGNLHMVDARNEQGLSPLMQAVAANDLDRVGKLLPASTVHRMQMIEGVMCLPDAAIVPTHHTLLLSAIAQAVHPELFGALVQASDLVNVANPAGLPPLIAAVESPQAMAYVATLLTAPQLHINQTNIIGESALYVAIKLHCALDLIKALTQGASDVNISPPETRESMLMLATRQADSPLIEHLIEQGAKLDAFNAKNESALYLAGTLESPTILSFLLDKGASPNIAPHPETCPLWDAVRNEKGDFLRALLMHGADLYRLRHNNESLLAYAQREKPAMYAILKAHEIAMLKAAIQENSDTSIRVVAHILDNDVDMNTEMEGRPIWMWALDNATPQMLGYFCAQRPQNSIRINTIHNQDTALIMMARAGKRQHLEVLLEAHADINQINLQTRESPLSILVTQGGPLDCVDLLIAHHADPQWRALDGSSLLHIAAQQDTPDALWDKLFTWRIGVDVRATNSQETPLISAAKAGKLLHIERLIDHQAQIDTQDNQGKTALMYAAARNDAAMVSAILRKKPDTRILDTQGNHALGMISDPAVKALIEGYEQETVFEAITCNDVERLRFLLRSGISPNLYHSSGVPALTFAVRNHANKGIIECLLAAKPDIFLKEQGWFGRTLYASEVDQLPQERNDIKLLLKDYQGKVLIEMITKSNLPAVQQIMQEHGPRRCFKDQMPALIYAIQRFAVLGTAQETEAEAEQQIRLQKRTAAKGIVACLLEHQADTSGQDPYYSAVQYEEPEILALLNDHNPDQPSFLRINAHWIFPIIPTIGILVPLAYLLPPAWVFSSIVTLSFPVYLLFSWGQKYFFYPPPRLSNDLAAYRARYSVENTEFSTQHMGVSSDDQNPAARLSAILQTGSPIEATHTEHSPLISVPDCSIGEPNPLASPRALSPVLSTPRLGTTGADVSPRLSPRP